MEGSNTDHGDSGSADHKRAETAPQCRSASRATDRLCKCSDGQGAMGGVCLSAEAPARWATNLTAPSWKRHGKWQNARTLNDRTKERKASERASWQSDPCALESMTPCATATRQPLINIGMERLDHLAHQGSLLEKQ